MLNLLKKWKNKEGSSEAKFLKEDIKNGNIPQHVAIIMDGNGRWAKKRALPRIAGHHEGMKVVRRITKLANEIGVEALTLYAFSTENWKRPKMEVDYLMKLPEEFLETFLPELIEENVQVRLMGDRNKLPAHTLNAVNKAIRETSHNNGLILNFALNYGSRTEIIQAVQQIAEKARDGKLQKEEIDENLFSNYLMTGTLKDPDLLIRTSGEIRLSNFMLWQLAYTEFWFTDVLWPDFREEHFIQAIGEFQQRGRRFGGV
ncbi:isoprenyl transferase [Metabacillus arenae]|uniref:Isoprenyl transferase n=1 Tax=Metabacillus arenae TaxID=2771434 RepID=A0A926RVT6_9BACI|nr:isoprenyl transferase [Metabacillus arenae]MBD1380043.1 isoprenyl transferase [Metabacillus arenae]